MDDAQLIRLTHSTPVLREQLQEAQDNCICIHSRVQACDNAQEVHTI